MVFLFLKLETITYYNDPTGGADCRIYFYTV